MVDTEDKEEPRFWRTVRDDIHHGDFKRTLSQDFAELKEYYLSKRQKERLAEMGWFKRFILTFFWLFKILLLRLSSARRILLLIGIVLFFLTINNNNNSKLYLIGGLILLFVLMLELKDKLLARDELSEGRLIQQALMPERAPYVAGWELWLYTRPANDVGGDLVDFMEISENHYYVTMADISGKGLGAALLMAKLQATVRAFTHDFQSLGRFAEKINHIFYHDVPSNSFASLICLELKSNSGDVQLINAGHAPPIILRENKTTELPKGGSAIGLLSDSVYHEKSLKLNKGNLLLIYSDGLTDARNLKGEFFGEQRLLNILSQQKNPSAQELGEKILKAVNVFIGDTRQYDDLSMIILKLV